ncbi:uncharacterized protein LOC118513201 [Anopheles stephensi]|uniref:uncharacterized protein LOC118513201 n=1 Tax=Anopheles stephensi TaxID=30069 RepID=UPI001658C1B6|nr:uncharacterized protein LOC118513201 [Anopheles stephensi]
MSLDNRKSSQLLAEMRCTANGAMTDSMLVDLWIGRLPPYVQSSVIAAAPNVADKVRVADSVMDSFALYHRTGSRTESTLEEVLNRTNPSGRWRPRSRSRPRQANRATTPAASGLCYYHVRVEFFHLFDHLVPWMLTN